MGVKRKEDAAVEPAARKAAKVPKERTPGVRSSARTAAKAVSESAKEAAEPAKAKVAKPAKAETSKAKAEKTDLESDAMEEEDLSKSDEDEEVPEAAAKKVVASKSAKQGTLSVGSMCPNFEVITHGEETVTLMDLVKDQGIVIFVYPKANTPGCTKQARLFRDNYGKITEAGFEVYGMSADNPVPQANWKVKNAFPYSLLCDKSKAALKSLGFLAGDKIKRSHVVVAKGGSILQHKVGVSPGDSYTLAYEAMTVQK